MKRFFLILTSLLLLASVSRAQAGHIYYVATNGSDSNSGTQSEPLRTIDQGLLFAMPGDTVQVADGIYTGTGNFNLEFYSGSVTLRSENGPTNCIIDCQANAANPRRAFLFRLGEGRQTVVEGFTITNGYIKDGNAGGGAIKITGSSPTIRNCIFTNNTASNPGGSTRVAGGAIYVDQGNPAILACRFLNNTALCTTSVSSVYAGALFCYESSVTAADCRFEGNRAFGPVSRDVGGGAVYAYSGSSGFDRCVFTNNVVEYTGSDVSVCSGGGMHTGPRTTLTLNACDFTRNRVRSPYAWGGGIRFGNDGTFTMTNCRLYGNSTEGSDYSQGGGVYATGGSVRILNCLVVGNQARGAETIGGGVYNRADTLLTNVTFAANAPDALYVTAASATMTNAVLYQNGTQEVSVDTEATVTAAYSNIRGGYSGTGNIQADPRYVRSPAPGADGTWGTGDDDYGDLGLQSGSPCINTGTASAPDLPVYDLDGRLRNVGDAPDMGAYEFNAPPYFDAALYVDKAAGSDITGNGTAGAPFQTVARALASLTSSAFTTIHIKASNYGSDRPRVTQRVRFVNWGNVGLARIGKP